MSEKPSSFLSRPGEDDSPKPEGTASTPQAEGPPPMIEAIGLSKFYGSFAATRD